MPPQLLRERMVTPSPERNTTPAPDRKNPLKHPWPKHTPPQPLTSQHHPKSIEIPLSSPSSFSEMPSTFMTSTVRTLCSPMCSLMARSTASSVLRRCSRGLFILASLFEHRFKVSQRRPEPPLQAADAMPLDGGAPPRALGSLKPKWLQMQ